MESKEVKPIESLCLSCKFGISVKGRIVQRSTIIDRHIEYDEENEEDDNPFGLKDWQRGLYEEDEEREEASAPRVRENTPKIDYLENYAPMYFNECFYPYTPLEGAKEKHKPIGLPDCVIDKCNRYEKMEV